MMQQKELISIIMPAYNTEDFIKDTLDSVIKQSYKNWELIAIDDGSSDNTGKILDEYSKLDSRILVIHIENKGVAYARNLGLSKATGQWIAFIDSDDLFSADALEKLVVASEGYEHVIGNFQQFGAGAKEYQIIDSNLNSREEIHSFERSEKGWILFYTLWGRLFRKNTVMIKFEEDCKAGEDTIFLQYYLKDLSKVRIIPDIVYKYRRGREDSLSSNYLNYSPLTRSKLYCAKRDFIGEDAWRQELLYNNFVNNTLHYAQKVMEEGDLATEDKKRIFSEIINCEYVKDSESRGYQVHPILMRRWISLKIGELDIIEEAFSTHVK